jgi:hypothetical protein
MALRIERSSEGYSASLSPPHTKKRWTTARPMRRGALKRALIARGAHVQDVVQLLDEVDGDYRPGETARAEF